METSGDGGQTWIGFSCSPIALKEVGVEESRTLRNTTRVRQLAEIDGPTTLRGDGYVECSFLGTAFCQFRGKLGGEIGVLLDGVHFLYETAGQFVAGLAWPLRRSPIMLPIPGTTSLEHVEENVAAAGVKLKDSEWLEIENSAK